MWRNLWYAPYCRMWRLKPWWWSLKATNVQAFWVHLFPSLRRCEGVERRTEYEQGYVQVGDCGLPERDDSMWWLRVREKQWSTARGAYEGDGIYSLADELSLSLHLPLAGCNLGSWLLRLWALTIVGYLMGNFNALIGAVGIWNCKVVSFNGLNGL